MFVFLLAIAGLEERDSSGAAQVEQALNRGSTGILETDGANRGLALLINIIIINNETDPKSLQF
jgi:hypothetical protein